MPDTTTSLIAMTNAEYAEYIERCKESIETCKKKAAELEAHFAENHGNMTEKTKIEFGSAINDLHKQADYYEEAIKKLKGRIRFRL